MLIVHVSAAEAMHEIRARADRGAASLRRDLPAIPVAHRRRTSDRAGVEGAKCVLQPAAARQGGAGGDLGRPRATAPSRSTPPTTRRTGIDETAQDPRGASRPLQEDRQRRARHRDAPAAAVLRRRQLKRPHRPSSSSWRSALDQRRASIYGLHPRKGTIAVGADADIAHLGSRSAR